MDFPVEIVNGKLFCCKQNHNEPIVMLAVDQGIPQSEMMHCLKCFQTKRQISKYISLEEAQTLIQEKLQRLNRRQEKEKQKILKELYEFSNYMMKIRSRVLQQIDEILSISELWITDISYIERKSDNLLEDLQLLQQEGQIDLAQYNKSNESHFKKIDLIIQNLIDIDDYIDCQNILKNILKIKIDEQQYKQKPQIIREVNHNIVQPILNKESQIIARRVQQTDSVKQVEVSFAMAFNNLGSIMVSGCGKDIKIWDFYQGKMTEKKKLIGHTENVTCLVFSKKHNWFASGSHDETIRCWKENDKEDWVSSKPGKQHFWSIYCLLMNKQEDQLISCSWDKTIKVWKVNFCLNQLEYDYSLENRHTSQIYCISLNESETALVSCGRDKRIILWSKGWFYNKWVYKHELVMEDEGYRISFINENQLVWQQQSYGITHLLEYKQGKLLKRPDLNLTLNQENVDDYLFPTIKNKKKQVIIQKHYRYVYILKQQANGQLWIEQEPIDCNDKGNFGTLTEDGEYLSIWNDEKQEFRVYNIKYE